MFKTLTIISSFREIATSYSLCTVVLDHIDAALLAGFHVEVLVEEGFDHSTVPEDLAHNLWVTWRPILPSLYQDREVCSERFEQTVRQYTEGKTGTIISHDLLFQEAFLPMAKAWHRIGHIPGWTVHHLAHSRPGERSTSPETLPRYTLPTGHRLVALSPEDREPLARYYDCEADVVSVLPNGRGLCRLMNHDQWVRDFTSVVDLETPEVVVVFPFSMPRWEAKGADVLLRVMGALSAFRTVKVVMIPAHANAAQEREARRHLDEVGRIAGLPADDIVWTTDHLLLQDHSRGLPGHCVGQLMQFSDLFLLPSISEACPLCLAEAQQAGCLCVADVGLETLRGWPGIHMVNLRGVLAEQVATQILSLLAKTEWQGRRAARRRLGLRRLGAGLSWLARAT